jgi:hypothetical protein
MDKIFQTLYEKNKCVSLLPAGEMVLGSWGSPGGISNIYCWRYLQRKNANKTRYCLPMAASFDAAMLRKLFKQTF